MAEFVAEFGCVPGERASRSAGDVAACIADHQGQKVIGVHCAAAADPDEAGFLACDRTGNGRVVGLSGHGIADLGGEVRHQPGCALENLLLREREGHGYDSLQGLNDADVGAVLALNDEAVFIQRDALSTDRSGIALVAADGCGDPRRNCSRLLSELLSRGVAGEESDWRPALRRF